MSVATCRGSPVAWVAVAVALLCAAPGGIVAGARPAGVVGGAVGPLSACAGGPLRNAYAGALVVDGGGAAAPDRGNVSIGFDYDYDRTVVNRSSGAVLSRSCLDTGGNATTAANGSFAVSLLIPASSCDQFTDRCTQFSGPYGPFAVGPTAGAPTGYATNVSIVGGNLTVAFVADLGGIRLLPSGPVAVVSPGAWEPIRAVPLMGNGSVSPVAATFNWSLSGAGWQFLQPPGGPEVNVSAAAAGFGELWAGARWSRGPASFSVGPANLTLEAIATAIVAADENRTSVDAGDLVAVSVTLSGAPGYTYSAIERPGLDGPARALACGPATAAGPAEQRTCTGTIPYPTSGIAAPTVVVTNGYSSATAALPNVTVAPDPTVAIAPATPYGYVGSPATVTVRGENGTGPFVGACLASGAGSTTCRGGPGPSWTFGPVYDAPGAFGALASVQDAAGTNSTEPLTVDIAAPLALGAFPANLSEAAAGAARFLSATVSGGFLPLRYWWNVSGAVAPIATGVAAADGTVAALWVPASPGPIVVSLAVVDAKGTAAARVQLVSVGNDPAEVVRATENPPAAGAMAGSPIDLGWAAVDGAGAAVPTFAAPGEVVLAGPNGTVPTPAWVNASGAGPLAPVAPGIFALPASAWSLGALNLSIATTVAGTWSVALVGLPGVPSPPVEKVAVGPDLAALQAYDPDVVRAGGRSNETFWHIRDAFGNPAVGAEVQLDFAGPGVSYDRVTTVVARPLGGAGVWMNFSAPTAGGGVLELVAPLTGILVGPLVVPAAPPGPAAPASSIVPYALAGAAGAAAAAVAVGLARRRAAARRPPPDGTMSEAELRAFVEGRDRVIRLVAEAGVADLAALDAAFGGSAPPTAVSDWVASLVADGTLGARTGPDGVARFCLPHGADGPARVVVDPAAADRAAAARAALLEDDGEAAGGDDDGSSDQAGSRPTRS